MQADGRAEACEGERRRGRERKRERDARRTKSPLDRSLWLCSWLSRSGLFIHASMVLLSTVFLPRRFVPLFIEAYYFIATGLWMHSAHAVVRRGEFFFPPQVETTGQCCCDRCSCSRRNRATELVRTPKRKRRKITARNTPAIVEIRKYEYMLRYGHIFYFNVKKHFLISEIKVFALHQSIHIFFNQFTL